MTDKLSKEKRSRIMSKICSSNTKIELKVRSVLHRNGYRYILHDKNIPGKPDIVLKKWKTIIFINGCFWHSHNCKIGHMPKSNIEYWEPKLKRNVSRFKKNIKIIKKEGWNVIVLWECQIIKWSDDSILKYIENKIKVR